VAHPGTVTISRLYGAGGIRVAEALAGALGFTNIDREVVEQAAAQLGMDPQVAESLDERAPALIEKAGLALAAAEIPPTPSLEDRALAEAVRRVIESLAATGGYVILGRGGQAALRDRADAIHLQLVGLLEDRARRIAEWRGIPLDEAREQCRQVDADRAAYVRRFHDVDIADPLLYDAVLNTSRLGIDGAVEAALAVVRGRIQGAT
jgi:cytidylate kinase